MTPREEAARIVYAIYNKSAANMIAKDDENSSLSDELYEHLVQHLERNIIRIEHLSKELEISRAEADNWKKGWQSLRFPENEEIGGYNLTDLAKCKK